MSKNLLEIRHASKTFPGLKALDDVSLTVGAGEIVGLIGQNGSGKSTLVKILAGIHDPDPGSEVVLGESADGGTAGLHFIHQDLGLVGMLSSIENLDLGHQRGVRGLLPTRSRRDERHAVDLIGRFGQRFDVRCPVSELTPAERTILAVARALDDWSTPNNVLCLDEPTAALHGEEVDILFRAVRQVAERGAGVIFVSHRLTEVVDISDRVVVLRDGKLIAEVARGEFDHEDLVRFIAGGLTAPAHAARRTSGRAVLRASGISGATVHNVSLDLHEGEVVGISGVLGSGREEIGGILFGASAGTVDELVIDGAVQTKRSPVRSIEAGMAFVPGDRHRDGAVMTMTVRENITLPQMAPLCTRAGRLDGKAEKAEAIRVSETVELRPLDTERELRLFSGGNQQKVVLGKWLRNEPRVLIMDEPTQGVDVGAKAGIYALIEDAAAHGAAVLLCSSDDKELALCCDRVIVLREGQIIAEVGREELSEAALLRVALGAHGANGAQTNGAQMYVSGGAAQ